MTSDARESAEQRLDAALIEQERSGAVYEATMGTSSEFEAGTGDPGRNECRETQLERAREVTMLTILLIIIVILLLTGGGFGYSRRARRGM